MPSACPRWPCPALRGVAVPSACLKCPCLVRGRTGPCPAHARGPRSTNQLNAFRAGTLPGVRASAPAHHRSLERWRNEAPRCASRGFPFWRSHAQWPLHTFAPRQVLRAYAWQKVTCASEQCKKEARRRHTRNFRGPQQGLHAGRPQTPHKKFQGSAASGRRPFRSADPPVLRRAGAFQGEARQREDREDRLATACGHMPPVAYPWPGGPARMLEFRGASSEDRMGGAADRGADGTAGRGGGTVG